MSRGQGHQPISMTHQEVRMRSRFPNFRVVERNRMMWRGEIRPREDGASFTLQIRAGKTLNTAPSVHVLAPVLVRAPGSKVAPHCFADESLCLYHRNENPWFGDQYIAETIIPWACEWCYFYEVWLETGRWFGPEYPHGTPKVPA
jgi:hypothetical protein